MKGESMTTPFQGRDALKRREAERLWTEAMRKRAQEIEPRIAAALRSRPGAWAVFLVFKHTKAFEATHHCNAQKAAKAAASEAMQALLALLANPAFESIVALEAQCGRRYGLLDAWRDGPSGMADRIAEALGVQLDPPPAVEDFRT